MRKYKNKLSEADDNINKLLKQVDSVGSSLIDQVKYSINHLDDSDCAYILKEYGDSFPMMMFYKLLKDPHPKIKKAYNKFNKDMLKYKI